MRQRFLYGLAYVGAWTLLGALFATQTYIGAWYSEHPLSWPQAFVVALTAWYVRALFAPAVLWLAHRFSFSRRSWIKSVIVHAAGSLVFALVELIVYDMVLLRVHSLPRRVLSPVELHMNWLTYWVLVGLAHLAAYYRRYRDRELAASRLAAELAGARLDLLRAQLHPHFLFNTLNGISELMHDDVEQADLMLGHLSDMLRFSLAHAGQREVTLGDELEFSRRYLEIQRMRFPERLAFAIHAPAALLACRVPYLVLQPLVENAVLHGIVPSPRPGRVEVKVCEHHGKLRLEVFDTGPGLSARALREGVGLHNTRQRLLHSYGEDGKLELQSLPAGGARALLELPLRQDDCPGPEASA
jgi:signal transduction histidine kinase